MLQYNIEHSREKVFKIEEKENLNINTLEKKYTSDWIFDSRPPDFKNIPNGDFNISQSFFGLKVELNEKELDQSVLIISFLFLKNQLLDQKINY